LEKFTESEYASLADGLSLLVTRELLGFEEYHALLIKLASNRASADNKPEVLISNVHYEKYRGGEEVAHGYALNHPRLGEMAVRTSLVISKATDGLSFETLNTRYVIVKNPKGDESDLGAVVNQNIPISKIL
jgi:hypothetical protein